MASYPLHPKDIEEKSSRRKPPGRPIANTSSAIPLGSKLENSSQTNPDHSRLETVPDGEAAFDVQRVRSALPHVESITRKPVSSGKAVQPLDKPLPSLPADSQRTEDATLYQRQAPAVTHETVYEHTHEHEHQRVTREIHEHHVYHRILPVYEVEVLPAVHYLQDHRGLRQVPEGNIAGKIGRDTQRILEESFKKALPHDNSPSGRRQFSARHFEGSEGDYGEGVTSTGAKRSETCWVHPPTLATGAKDAGQTKAFHFDAS